MIPYHEHRAGENEKWFTASETGGKGGRDIRILLKVIGKKGEMGSQKFGSTYDQELSGSLCNTWG